MISIQVIFLFLCQPSCSFRCGISKNIKHPVLISCSPPGGGGKNEGRVRDAEGGQESISLLSIGRLYRTTYFTPPSSSPPLGC